MTDQNRSKLFVQGLLFAACIVPIMLLLNYLERPELMYPVLGASAAIVIAVRGRWDLRGRPWFWGTMILVIAVHSLVIWRVPWKAGWVPAPITMLLCVVDVALIFGILGIIEKLMNKSKEDGNEQGE